MKPSVAHLRPRLPLWPRIVKCRFTKGGSASAAFPGIGECCHRISFVPPPAGMIQHRLPKPMYGYRRGADPIAVQHISQPPRDHIDGPTTASASSANLVEFGKPDHKVKLSHFLLAPSSADVCAHAEVRPLVATTRPTKFSHFESDGLSICRCRRDSIHFE